MKSEMKNMFSDQLFWGTRCQADKFACANNVVSIAYLFLRHVPCPE
jgi:hypothetical protein